MIGIDEAGLGPVLGSMFVCGVKIDSKCSLPDGIKDSKDLSINKIYNLADEIYESDCIHVCTLEIEPSEFEDSMNLNKLTKKKHSKVIDYLSPSENEEVYVDSCDSDTDKFKKCIENLTESNVNIIAENKADENYKIVGAASIVAKYSREQHISELSSKYGEIGSGYPSDKKTVNFIKKYYNKNKSFPWFARDSWKTCRELKQQSLEDFS